MEVKMGVYCKLLLVILSLCGIRTVCAICSPDCGNHGSCIDHDICKCEPAYRGDTCNIAKECLYDTYYFPSGVIKTDPGIKLPLTCKALCNSITEANRWQFVYDIKADKNHPHTECSCINAANDTAVVIPDELMGRMIGGETSTIDCFYDAYTYHGKGKHLPNIKLPLECRAACKEVPESDTWMMFFHNSHFAGCWCQFSKGFTNDMCKLAASEYVFGSRIAGLLDNVPVSNYVEKCGYRNSIPWTGGIIPYEFLSSAAYSPEHKKRILAAMYMYEQHTCVKFRPKTNDDKHWIRILKGRLKGLCYTWGLGMYGQGWQTLSILYGCGTRETAHELGHVLGFGHDDVSGWTLKSQTFVDLVNTKYGCSTENIGKFQKKVPRDWNHICSATGQALELSEVREGGKIIASTYKAGADNQIWRYDDEGRLISRTGYVAAVAAEGPGLWDKAGPGPVAANMSDAMTQKWAIHGRQIYNLVTLRLLYVKKDSTELKMYIYWTSERTEWSFKEDCRV